MRESYCSVYIWSWVLGTRWYTSSCVQVSIISPVPYDQTVIVNLELKHVRRLFDP